MTGRRKSYTKRGENDTAFQQGAKEVMEKKGKKSDDINRDIKTNPSTPLTAVQWPLLKIYNYLSHRKLL